MDKKAWDALSVPEKLALAGVNARLLHLKGPDGPSYLTTMNRQRTEGHPDQAGSFFTKEFLTRKSDGVIESPAHRLFADNIEGWKAYPDCPNLLEGCEAFKIDLTSWAQSHSGGYGIPCVVGVLDLDADRGRFDDTIDLVAADPKQTGHIELHYKWDSSGLNALRRPGVPVDFAVAIVELAERDSNGNMVEHKPILATFHPGDPVMPSRVEKLIPGIKPGDLVSVSAARSAGVRYVKIV